MTKKWNLAELNAASPCAWCRVTDLLLHNGGIHSGCGLSSLLWLSLAISQLLSAQVQNEATIVLAWVVLAALIASMAAAFPLLRWCASFLLTMLRAGKDYHVLFGVYAWRQV